MANERVARRMKLILLGLVAGLTSGLLGVGGGIVMVPLLVGWLDFSQHEAHTTSLLAIIPIAAAGGASFAAAGEVEPSTALALALGAVAGAPLGARIMAAITESALRLIFGLFIVGVAIRLLLA